jgi:hypothetical protein
MEEDAGMMVLDQAAVAAVAVEAEAGRAQGPGVAAALGDDELVGPVAKGALDAGEADGAQDGDRASLSDLSPVPSPERRGGISGRYA